LNPSSARLGTLNFSGAFVAIVSLIVGVLNPPAITIGLDTVFFHILNDPLPLDVVWEVHRIRLTRAPGTP